MAVKNKSKNVFIISCTLIIALIAIVFYIKKTGFGTSKEQAQGPNVAWDNYHVKVIEAANEFKVDPTFFLALITNECGGRLPAPSRFEKHVFKRLVDVKTGKLENYELVKSTHLKNCNEGALRNLASSWGPFQIMGYKVIAEGIEVKDLRGENGVKVGMQWIVKEYGKLLTKNRFSDAFHFHNSGTIIGGGGKTYHPFYVKNGIKAMKYFYNKLNERVD